MMESLWMLIAIFQLQYCKSSSGDEVYCLLLTICSKLVHCHWCISILIIIPVVRWFSLIGPHWLAVVLFDHGYPSFGNFDSTIPINVVEMKSYMDSLIDLSPYMCTSGVMINKLNLAPNRNMPHFVSMLRNHSTRKLMSLSCSFILYTLISLFCWYTLCHIHMGSCKWHLLVLMVCTKWDLSVVSDLKMVHMPWCCRQQRRTSNIHPLCNGELLLPLLSLRVFI